MPASRSPVASGKPRYDLLGTPAPGNVLTLYGTDHFIPRTELMNESLAWLDTHLGPVERCPPSSPHLVTSARRV